MKKKIVFLIVIVGLVAGAYTGYKYLYKDHRNIAQETAVTTVSANEMLAAFQNESGTDFLNKTIIVNGTITQIEANSITLDEVVQCSFDRVIDGMETGRQVSVKGRCLGYDDLFEIVKLDQSSIIDPL